MLIFKWAVASTDVNATPAGLAATGEIGSATLTANAGVSPDGLDALGALGTATVTAAAAVAPSGLAATGDTGSATVTANAGASPSGLEATGALGTLTVSGDANQSPSGLAADSALGDLVIIGDALVDLSGLHASGATGDPTLTGDGSHTAEGLPASATLGTLSVTASSAPPFEFVGGGASDRLIRRLFPKLASRSTPVGPVPSPGVSVRVAIAGLAGAGAIGQVTVQADAAIPLSPGRAGRAQAGRVSVAGHAVIHVRGLSLVAYRSRAQVRAIQNPTDDELTAILLLIG